MIHCVVTWHLLVAVRTVKLNESANASGFDSEGTLKALKCSSFNVCAPSLPATTLE